METQSTIGAPKRPEPVAPKEKKEPVAEVKSAPEQAPKQEVASTETTGGRPSLAQA